MNVQIFFASGELTPLSQSRETVFCVSYCRGQSSGSFLRRSIVEVSICFVRSADLAIAARNRSLLLFCGSISCVEMWDHTEWGKTWSYVHERRERLDTLRSGLVSILLLGNLLGCSFLGWKLERILLPIAWNSIAWVLRLLPMSRRYYEYRYYCTYLRTLCSLKALEWDLKFVTALCYTVISAI